MSFDLTTLMALAAAGLGLIGIYGAYRARRSSTMPPERKAKVFKYGLVVGVALIGLGSFTYIREAMSPITAEKLVQIERGRVRLPTDLDSFTRWDAIEASGRLVRYFYTVRKTPRSREALANGLQRQLTNSVCEQELYLDAIKQGISFEFVYRFADESYPPIVVSPAGCGK